MRRNDLILTFLMTAAMCLVASVGAYADVKEMIFPLKTITTTSNIFSAIGTMKGDGIFNPKNTYRIICRRERQYCAVMHVELIQDNQISSISVPLEYPILKWTDAEIIWGDAEYDTNECERERFVANLKTKEIDWYSESTNAQMSYCKALYNGNTWSYHWKLSDGFRGDKK